jgi:hypothetical protein
MAEAACWPRRVWGPVAAGGGSLRHRRLSDPTSDDSTEIPGRPLPQAVVRLALRRTVKRCLGGSSSVASPQGTPEGDR